MAIVAGVLCPAGWSQLPAVHEVQGSYHGFLEMRAEDGKVIAAGDSTQTVKGDRVIGRTLFRFKDGSVDDETTVFTQRHGFKLISDHHLQKGPSFPHPMDVLVDAVSGQVTSHSPGKDGKDEMKTDHIDVPTDLANGLIPHTLENLRPAASGTTVSMVVMIPKPRVVKLHIAPVGETTFEVGGQARKANHYEIKIELGGLVGVIAPIVGKAPPDIQIWTVGGVSSSFAKEIGPLYPEGPTVTIELAAPVWK